MSFSKKRKRDETQQALASNRKKFKNNRIFERRSISNIKVAIFTSRDYYHQQEQAPTHHQQQQQAPTHQQQQQTLAHHQQKQASTHQQQEQMNKSHLAKQEPLIHHSVVGSVTTTGQSGACPTKEARGIPECFDWLKGCLLVYWFTGFEPGGGFRPTSDLLDIRNGAGEVKFCEE